MLKTFQKNKSLSSLSTLGIGGIAKYFTEISSVIEMQEVLAFCNQENLPFHLVGKGSNSLFDDAGFEGLIIQNKITFFELDHPIISVGAGFNFSLLGVKTARLGLAGLEFASGIPATVGGAIFMNAGASGSEVKDTLSEVSFVNEKGELMVFKREELEFRYRWSIFQTKKGAIVGAKFTLVPSQEARQKQLEILEYRINTQPYGDLSCGCVFRNPEHLSAGALIEQCGLKGKRFGGAEVSTLHANFIINRNDATASDIMNLALYVKQCVKERTGVELEMELRKIPSHA